MNTRWQGQVVPAGVLIDTGNARQPDKQAITSMILEVHWKNEK